MKAPVYLNLVVEDRLSEAVLRSMLRQLTDRSYEVRKCYQRGGFGYIKKNLRGFNHAAKGTPFLVLTDLDENECPLALMREWLPVSRNPNLLFRVAVREVEAWVLADRKAFAGFLGIREELIPDNVDQIKDPKRFLIGLAGRSRRGDLRQDIVPSPGSTSRQGPNYNGRLILFVEKHWCVAAARRHSPSLERAVAAVTKFEPV